jgi:hypothetical protein
VEIQFEFPVEDIQAWASRPSLSKTALVLVEGQASEPWKRAFRWRIPHLPSGDSVEFTFRSVDSPSGDYEVALYNSDLVIVEKVIGEPAPPKRRIDLPGVIFLASVITVAIATVVGLSVGFLVSPTGEELSSVSQAGCELRIASYYDRFGNGFRSPFRIKYSVFNIGSQGCVVQSAQLNPKGLFTIPAGEAFEREWIIERAPRVIDTEVSVGPTNSTLKDAPIRLYVER